MKKIAFFIFPLGAVLLAIVIGSCQSHPKNHVAEPPKPRNIILLIADGMGYAYIQAAMMYSDQPLYMEQFPVTGITKTASLDDEITDSGAAATALATGFKTNNRMIGMLPDGTPVKNLVEIAAEKGIKTGVVSNSAITHATPAAFLAHNNSRYNREEIAYEIATKAPVSLFMGGGLDHFIKRKDSLNLLDSLTSRGFVLDTVFNAHAWECHPRQAIFMAKRHMAPAHKGRGDQLVKAVEHAINCLNNAEDGFFLMMEGALIDFAGHDGDSAYLLSEMYDFDQAVGIALNFAKTNGETLVIVTSDHETGGLTLINPGKRDGRAYFHFSSDDHSADLVPVFAFGPGADTFNGMYENTEIMTKIKQLMR
jgi:alkaline phosphatase